MKRFSVWVFAIAYGVVGAVAAQEREERTVVGEALERARQAVEERERLVPGTPEDFRRDLEEMAALQRRLRLLELRIREAEAEARLRSLAAPPESASERDRGGREGERARQEVERRRTDVETQALVAVAMPRVVMVTGSGAMARAIVLVPFLGEQVVAPGDRVGEWEIVTVDARGVEARRGEGNPVRWAFGRSVPALPPFQWQERGTAEAASVSGPGMGIGAAVTVPVPIAPGSPMAIPPGSGGRGTAAPSSASSSAPAAPSGPAAPSSSPRRP